MLPASARTHLFHTFAKKAPPEATALSLSKNLCRTAIKNGRGGVYVASAADFYAGKSHFPEKKSLPCRFHGRNPKDSSEIW